MKIFKSSIHLLLSQNLSIFVTLGLALPREEHDLTVHDIRPLLVLCGTV